MMRDNGSPMPHSPPTCGVCPAFADNLCHILSQASRESVPPSAVTDHTAQARRTIWREGDAVDRVPVICQGWAATSMSLSDGRRQLLSFLLPGDLVSAGLIGHTAAPCTVEAVTDVRYRSFSRATINQALTRQPDLLAVMARMLAEETARADRLAIDLGRRGAAARIANLILALTERLRKRGMMAGQTMDFPLRQHHIADAAGLTVVHVGNVLAEFRRDRLLEFNDRSLTILDQTGLGLVADTP